MAIIKYPKCKFSLISPNLITPTPKNELVKAKKDLAIKALDFDKLTSNQYQRFITDYLSYLCGKYCLKDLSFLFNPEQKKFNAKTTQGENLIEYGSYIFKKPASHKSFFDVLDTIEHEIAHNIQFQKIPYNYQKFDNENGIITTIPVNDSLRWLSTIAYQRYANQIMKISKAIYNDCPEEKFARKQAISGCADFLKEIKQVAKEQHLFNEKNKNFIKEFNDNIKRHLSDEIKKNAIAKKYLAKDSSALDITKKTIEEALHCFCKKGKKLSDTELIEFCFLLSEPLLSNQNQRDRFFTACYNKALKAEYQEEVTSYLIPLALLSTFYANTNTKFHLEAIFAGADYLDKKKNTNFVCELYSVFQEDIMPDHTLNTIPHKYINNIFHKYHTDKEYEQFLKEFYQDEEEVAEIEKFM